MSKNRVFRFTIPDDGEEILAKWTTPGDFAITRMKPGLCTKGKHNFEFILCVTQFGIDRQRDIVVSRCKKCGLTLAYKIVTMDDLKTAGETEFELKPAPAV